MNEIASEYIIDENTMALLPAYAIDYATVVWERDRLLYIKEKPLDLIKTNCLNDYASYEGKRTAVAHHTGTKRKIPIPINIDRKIYAFPTHSPTLFDCQWIFYHHVKSIDENPNRSKENGQSIITFKNGQQLYMHQSVYLLDRQMSRTERCMIHFSPVLT